VLYCCLDDEIKNTFREEVEERWNEEYLQEGS